MKKCPFCAEMIQDEAIKCRYCGSMLNGTALPVSSGSDPVADEARQRLLVDGKIEVIKFVRERKRIGLAEAKAYVEALQAEQDPNTAAAAAAARSTKTGCTPLVVFWLIALLMGIAIYAFFRSG